MSCDPSQPVTAAQILSALSTVRRRGQWPLIQELETSDPELASYLMEELSLIHKALLDTGNPPKLVRRLQKQVQSLMLVVVLASRASPDDGGTNVRPAE